MISIKNLDLNKIKIDEQSYRNILIYYIRYVTIKNHKKTTSVNTLYLIFGKINGHNEKSIGNKYLALDPTNKSKDKLKNYEELWNKIRYSIRPVIDNSDD